MLYGSLLKEFLCLGLFESKADEALACRGVKFLGSIDKNDVLFLWVDNVFDHDSDVH
jgi:hypothetical protein